MKINLKWSCKTVQKIKILPDLCLYNGDLKVCKLVGQKIGVTVIQRKLKLINLKISYKVSVKDVNGFDIRDRDV